jgi:hypothetical protein
MLALLVAVALLVGCGSSGPTGTTSSAIRTRASAPPRLPGPAYAYKTREENLAAVQKAVDECKGAVMDSDEVTFAEKSELATACDEGLTGHEPFQVYVTSKAVCGELALLIPDRSKQAKERAFATCYARAKRWR